MNVWYAIVFVAVTLICWVLGYAILRPIIHTHKDDNK